MPPSALWTGNGGFKQPQGRQAYSGHKRAKVAFDSDILGAGNSLQIDLLDIRELSGSLSIEPDGTIDLPLLRALYAERVTVEELWYFLSRQFKACVNNLGL